MSDGSERQIRARRTVVVAVAAVLLLVAGVVAVLADSGSSSDSEAVADAASRTVWAATATPDELAAAAGGRADVETVTNEGPESCSMVFERCPAPGVLFTAEGEPAPGELRGCPAILHAPTELAPGESRRDVFTADCTVRITETRLTLRSEADPGAAERTFTDGAERWCATDTDRTVAYATFSPIDLPPGEYEGVIAIHLASGEALPTPARLLVN